MTLRSRAIRAWLRAERTENGGYRHVHLREAGRRRGDGVSALVEIVKAAHEDQRQSIAALMAPLDPQGRQSPGAGLVDLSVLHTSTLQGYLGEILAGVVAENYEPHGRNWRVPGFTFRFDQDAETALIAHLRGDGAAAATFGRHGDDCLAFAFGDADEVLGYLVCEGKCTGDHRKSMIDAGHTQLSDDADPAPGVLRLLQVVEASRDAGTEGLASSLQEWLLSSDFRDTERCDLLVYVCGRSPSSRSTWMSTATANEKYTAARKLEAAEAHIRRVRRLVARCYPGHEPSD